MPASAGRRHADEHLPDSPTRHGSSPCQGMPVARGSTGRSRARAGPMEIPVAPGTFSNQGSTRRSSCSNLQNRDHRYVPSSPARIIPRTEGSDHLPIPLTASARRLSHVDRARPDRYRRLSRIGSVSLPRRSSQYESFPGSTSESAQLPPMPLMAWCGARARHSGPRSRVTWNSSATSSRWLRLHFGEDFFEESHISRRLRFRASGREE